ncbi:MAG: hypothetical protein EBQ96_09655 [Proteobacteria bacterium]|nr:hypothetical protein [Pseudomonadota bacterium]
MPTTEITFKNFDKYNREAFAKQLTKALKVLSLYDDGAYVLSLNARFGSGKSTFIRMWKADLEAEPESHSVIILNAWESDFSEDPILPICHALLESLPEKSSKAATMLKKTMKSVIAAVTLTSSAILEKHTGINVTDISKASTEAALEKKEIQEIGEEIFEVYTFKRDALKHLRNALADYAKSLEHKPLVIFVDELDRCRPAYAVHFLETIKHIFSVNNVCFVLAVDRAQLKASVRQLYGDVDFEGYYKKFVTREADLPDGNANKFFVEHLAQVNFDEKRGEGVKFPFDRILQDRIVRLISDLCDVFNLVPREIEHIFRVFSQVSAVETNKMASGDFVECLALLVVIRFVDAEFSKKLGTGSVSASEVRNFIVKYNIKSKKDETLEENILLSLLYGIMNYDNEKRRVIYGTFAAHQTKKSSITAQDEENARQHFNSFFSMLPTGQKTPFEILYEAMQNWKPFIN